MTVSIDRYNIQWIGRCQFTKNTNCVDKIWGWFQYNNVNAPFITSKLSRGPVYSFWANTTKSISIITHPSSWYAKKITQKKIVNAYTPIEIDDLIEYWPDFYSNLDSKFIFKMLSESL